MKIFLTGTPGVGKSTVLTKVRDLLKGRPLLGCVVRECRENGSRIGFDLVKIPSEDTFPLARKNNSLGAIFHSKYSVNVPLLTQDLIPYMDFMKNAQNTDVLLFDEIGHMQNKCPMFLKALDDLLKTQTPLIATILADDEAWARPYKNRSDIFYLSVTPENRDIIPSLVDDLLRQNLYAKNLPQQVFLQYIHTFHKLFYQNRFLELEKLCNHTLKYLGLKRIQKTNTPNTYIVNGDHQEHTVHRIHNEYTCTCPFKNSNKNLMCSHIFSVMLFVDHTN